VKSERAWSAFEDYPSTLIDQVQSVGPSRVRLLHLIVDPIDQRRHANPQIADTTIGDLHALGIGARIAEDYALPNIATHLPDIARMCFLYVHRVEGHPVAIRVQ